MFALRSSHGGIFDGPSLPIIVRDSLLAILKTVDERFDRQTESCPHEYPVTQTAVLPGCCCSKPPDPPFYRVRWFLNHWHCERRRGSMYRLSALQPPSPGNPDTSLFPVCRQAAAGLLRMDARQRVRTAHRTVGAEHDRRTGIHQLPEGIGHCPFAPTAISMRFMSSTMLPGVTLSARLRFRAFHVFRTDHLHMLDAMGDGRRRGTGSVRRVSRSSKMLIISRLARSPTACTITDRPDLSHLCDVMR